MLSNKHFGDASAITESSIHEILDEVKDRLIGSTSKELHELSRKYQDEQEKRHSAEAIAIRAEAEKNSIMIRLSLKAERKARYKTKVCAICFRIIQWLFILAPTIPAVAVSYWFFSLNALFALASIWMSSKTNIEENIYVKLLKIEKAKLMLDDVSDDSRNLIGTGANGSGKTQMPNEDIIAIKDSIP
jgi:vacuolar-type H+-ATPase subunit H